MKNMLGGSHPAVGSTLNSMGTVCRTQGNCAKALELYEQALAIRKGALGDKHPDVADTLREIASVHNVAAVEAKDS